MAGRHKREWFVYALFVGLGGPVDQFGSGELSDLLVAGFDVVFPIVVIDCRHLEWRFECCVRVSCDFHLFPTFNTPSPSYYNAMTSVSTVFVLWDQSLALAWKNLHPSCDLGWNRTIRLPRHLEHPPPRPKKKKLIKILRMPVAPQECSSLSVVTFLKQWAILKGWATGECLTGQTTEVSCNELRGFDLLSWQCLSDSNDKPRGSPNKSCPTNFISRSCRPLISPLVPAQFYTVEYRNTAAALPFTKTVYIYKMWWTVCVVFSQTPHTVRPNSEFLRKSSPEIQYIKVQL